MADDEFQILIRLLRETSEEAVTVAENAAAEVYKTAIQNAAPRDSGQLSVSVKIIEGRPITKTLTGSTRNRLFVGPEKKKGYYGYWVEKGWRHPIGPKITYTTTKGDRWNPAGHTYTTGRLRRLTGRAAHSQMGTTQYKTIPARPWFYRAVEGAERKAIAAAEEAFYETVNQLDK